MKAIILRAFGSADNFELVDVPIPEIQKGQVRIRIKAVSFNPVDYQIRKGLPESKGHSSNILGKDLSGVVDEVHKDVTDITPGDEVICYVCNLASSGTYTEYVTVPAEIVGRKPNSLTHEEAASIPVAGITAFLAISKARVSNSKSVFVAGGAGGVGTYALMLAQSLGALNIFSTAGNNKSLNYLIENLQVKKFQILNYREADFKKKALERNGGYFDSVIDLVGDKMLSACCELVAIDGNLASVTQRPEAKDFDILFQRNASFHSIGANAYSLSDTREHWKVYKNILNNLAQLLDNNSMRKPGINILGPLSVDTVRKAHELLERNTVQGKLIMTC